MDARTEHLDVELARTCAVAVQNAYAAYDGTDPIPIAGWTVQAEVAADADRDGAAERFGLVYRSTATDAAPTMLVALRGTASLADVIDDLWIETTALVSFDQVVQPVSVAAGFVELYAASDNAGTPSLQSQLFAALDHLEPRRVIVTGHSLGAAVALLFVLDLGVTRATAALPATVLTFAGPRVGHADFASCYAALTTQQTIRVVNFRDFVPALPPTLLGYQHVPSAYLIDFWDADDQEFTAPTERHSMTNYQTVIDAPVQPYPYELPGVYLDWHGAWASTTLAVNDPADDPPEGDASRADLKRLQDQRADRLSR